MEEDPFKELHIADPAFLDELSSRTECPKCGRTRKYYCYTCYVPMTCIEEKIPKVKLPVKIDVIKHPSEVDGKSTAVHAAVLAPDDVTMYTYPAIPDYEDPSRVILIFPGDKSVTLEDLGESLASSPSSATTTKDTATEKGYSPQNTSANRDPATEKGYSPQNTSANRDPATEKGYSPQNTSANRDPATENSPQNTSANRDPATEKGNSPQNTSDNRDPEGATKRKADNTEQEEPAHKKTCSGVAAPYDRVVFIDSTWNQTMKIYKDERLKGVKQVELKTRTTKFWRYQRDKPNTYLATIEAIYYFIVDHHKLFVSESDKGQYDNLLFFFSFMYRKIRNLYDGGQKLKAYQKDDKRINKQVEKQSAE